MIKWIFQTLTTNFEKIKSNMSFHIALKFSKILVCIGLIIHFTIIFFSLANDNPIKHQYRMEIEKYVNPYFSQAWTLFAPNPINSNMALLLNCTVVDSTGKVDELGWIDVSSPIIEHRENNFFSPMQRVAKFTQSCMSDIHRSHVIVKDMLVEHRDDVRTKEDSIQFMKDHLYVLENSNGHKSIISYSKSVVKRRLEELKINNSKEVYVKYRILDMRFPRFSKRDLDYYDLENYEINKTDSRLYKINL